MSAGRYFTPHERMTLFEIADGKCEQCGVPLDETFHADHHIPYSAGGKTTIANGRALCPQCNLKKGSTVPTQPMIGLRRWQQEAIDKFNRLAKAHRVFVVEACPGAGKTRFALQCAKQAGYERVFVLTHTTSLQHQWETAASRFDFNLSLGKSLAGPNGACWTLGLVSRSSAVCAGRIRREAREHRTLLIIDEMHHLGQQKTWGQAAAELIAVADRTLALSGTPFRHDDDKIAGCEYAGVPEELVVHYRYGYRDGLADGVVLPIEFLFQTGRGVWLNGTQTKEARLHETQSEVEISRALQSIIKPDSEWVNAVCRHAVDDLLKLRRSKMPNAALLFIADNKAAAHHAGRRLSRILGVDVPVATEDDDHAHRTISDFARSTAPAIVAVNMINEGVDIPRLKIGIHASATRTELFVRQMVGRFIRTTGDLVEDGVLPVLHMPAVTPLIEIAKRIETDCKHVLNERDQLESLLDRADTPSVSTTVILPGADPEMHTALRSGNSLEQGDLALAEKIRRGLPERVLTTTIGEIIKQVVRPDDVSQGIRNPDVQRVETFWEKHQRLRKALNAVVGKAVLVHELPWKMGYKGDKRGAFMWLHLELQEWTNGLGVDDCTAEVLEERIELLQDWIDRKSNA